MLYSKFKPSEDVCFFEKSKWNELNFLWKVLKNAATVKFHW